MMGPIAHKIHLGIGRRGSISDRQVFFSRFCALKATGIISTFPRQFSPLLYQLFLNYKTIHLNFHAYVHTHICQAEASLCFDLLITNNNKKRISLLLPSVARILLEKTRHFSRGDYYQRTGCIKSKLLRLENNQQIFISKLDYRIE